MTSTVSGEGGDPLRVALDMTFPYRNPASGSSVYAVSLAHALGRVPSVQPLELSGPRSAGLPATLHWLVGGARTAIRAAAARLLHCPAFITPWRSPVPIVISMLDAAAFRFPADYPPEWRLYNRFVLPRLARRARGVIAVSEAAREDIALHYRIPAPRIAVTYLGVRETYYTPPEPAQVDELRARLGGEEPLLLFVGAPLERKNLQLVLETMDAAAAGSVLSQARLVVSGAAAHDFPHHLRRIAARGLSDRVRWLGRVDAACMPVLYAAADVLVYPSFYEGFGLPPLEAMAVGTPVVASTAGSLPEVLNDAALLVEPTDVGGFAAAVEAVLTRPELRGRLIAAGRTQVTRYTWDRCAELTAAAYRAAVANS